ETVARAVLCFTLANKLRCDVATLCEHVACDVRVVAADVALLRLMTAEHAARTEEEFQDLDIRRQLVVAQIRDVVGIGTIAVDALDEGGEKRTLELARSSRLFQRQRGEQTELERGIALGARIERVHQLHGLAESERQADRDSLAHARNDLVDRTFDI